MTLEIDVDAARERLRDARSLLVLTGAGVSVASGLPVYRGEAGSLYDDPKVLRHAFASTLRKDPVAFWQVFGPRRARLVRAEPNAAHHALARAEKACPRFLLATQNVDGLHRRSGSSAVVELHGNMAFERCLDSRCATPAWASETLDEASAPRCPRCGGIARPDVVLFGEGASERWEPVIDFCARGVDSVLLVGTSGTVPVPADLLGLAGLSRAWVLEINPRPSDDADVSARVDARILAPAEVALPRLFP